jgi:hypothetical protein
MKLYIIKYEIDGVINSLSQRLETNSEGEAIKAIQELSLDNISKLIRIISITDEYEDKFCPKCAGRGGLTYACDRCGKRRRVS